MGSDQSKVPLEEFGEHIPEEGIAADNDQEPCENILNISVCDVSGEASTLSMKKCSFGMEAALLLLHQRPPAKPAVVKLMFEGACLDLKSTLADQGLVDGSEITCVLHHASENELRKLREKVVKETEFTHEELMLWSTMQNLTLEAMPKILELPSRLRVLTFGRNFNGSMEGRTLPKHLQSITFGYWFNQSMAKVALPEGLQSLTFGERFDHSLDNVALPSTLESLTFGRDFNQSMENAKLPDSLRHLTFGINFDQSLEKVALPSGLQSLAFGYMFNQSMANVTLPSGLHSLTFGYKFDQRMEKVTLPSGLRSLTFCRNSSKVESVALPTGLRTLTIGWEVVQRMEKEEKVALPGDLTVRQC
eukprot:TRINITY_DN50169_c0_g1_i1.p1 TRINITY_DN50169_c0_g1~~TRINITY_DN50169_c0_g1_i1.p1  ORF type:complete len:362 (-),score=84.22 TRINITY_DN50169_c0_g1_i1:94-1179(-)